MDCLRQSRSIQKFIQSKKDGGGANFVNLDEIFCCIKYNELIYLIYLFGGRGYFANRIVYTFFKLIAVR